MIPRLFHIYGQFYINSYGLCIALGLLLVMWLSQNDARKIRLLNTDQFISLLMYSIGGALIGGRILYLLTSWDQLEHPFQAFELWNGGGSVLGCIIGILCIIPWFAHKNNIPVLEVLDFTALYAPLLQSISRIGCFLAGCCYGKPASYFFAMTYCHPDVAAPRFISLHPTQLYSSLLLFLIFLMLSYAENHLQKAGQLISLYLMLSSLERFLVDFLRGDQQFFGPMPYCILSINQWIALILFCAASLFLLGLTFITKTNESF